MGFRARIEDLSASEIASLTRRVHTDLTVRFSAGFPVSRLSHWILGTSRAGLTLERGPWGERCGVGGEG